MRAPQIGFAQLVQDFFLRRLVAQRGASARTVESYRDAFELLFGFIEQRTGRPAAALQLADLDAPVVLDFLDHLETGRGNSIRTRNARLAAIHSFMRYAAVRDPASLPVTGRVLAIPAKRFDRPVLGYLSREQIAAILAAPDRRTWSGHRDAIMLATTYNTGARVSEITALQVRDVLLDRQTAVLLHGKGRKHRVIPLWKNTATGLRAWLDMNRPGSDGGPGRFSRCSPMPWRSWVWPRLRPAGCSGLDRPGSSPPRPAAACCSVRPGWPTRADPGQQPRAPTAFDVDRSRRVIMTDRRPDGRQRRRSQRQAG